MKKAARLLDESEDEGRGIGDLILREIEYAARHIKDLHEFGAHVFKMSNSLVVCFPLAIISLATLAINLLISHTEKFYMMGHRR